MGRLFLLFTIVPLAELYLLLFIGERIGFWPTVAIVLFTGALGALLARLEGLRVLTEWQRALAEGRMPPEGVLGGVMVLVGGVLLVTPGVMTDVVGFVLLIPITRKAIATIVRRRLEKMIEKGQVTVVDYRRGPFGGSPPADGPFGSAPSRGGDGRGEVIDVEGEDVSDASAEEKAQRRLPRAGR